MKLVASVVILSFSFVSNFTNAGLITDTANDSFFDEATGLEWMDFGVNNTMTYLEVVAELEKGGLYEGWVVANETRVKQLWENLYFSSADLYIPEKFYSISRDSDLWASYIPIIGFNCLCDDPANLFRFNNALFLGDDNNIKLATYSDSFFINQVSSFAWLGDFYEELPPGCNDVSCGPYPNGYKSQNIYRASYNGLDMSTLLVRRETVPEPSTLTIFALGLMSLVARRFKIKKNLCNLEGAKLTLPLHVRLILRFLHA
jgi:hypothetical protein